MSSCTHIHPSLIHLTMTARMGVLLLVMAVTVCVSNAQATNSSIVNKQQQKQQRSIWDEPIKFSTKTKDSCSMVVSGAGDYTRLRVSCKGPSRGQTPGSSYYCDFQGKPTLCRAYNLNPRHYFTQMMWELRKLSHACQGTKVYRPHMCKKYSDEAQMTFLASWPKITMLKPSKPVQVTYKLAVPAQTKAIKPQPGKAPQARTTTPKPVKTTNHPTEQPESRASKLASEYCWKKLHGICTYFISWFQN